MEYDKAQLSQGLFYYFLRHIYYSFLTKMKKDTVVTMKWGDVYIPFHVEVNWNGDQPVRKLVYETVIEGAKDHNITVVSPCSGEWCMNDLS